MQRERLRIKIGLNGRSRITGSRPARSLLLSELGSGKASVPIKYSKGRYEAKLVTDNQTLLRIFRNSISDYTESTTSEANGARLTCLKFTVGYGHDWKSCKAFLLDVLIWAICKIGDLIVFFGFEDGAEEATEESP